MQLNKEQLKEDIIIQLGGDPDVGIPVEIGEKGLNVSIKRTIEVYSRYKPLIRHESYRTEATGIWVHQCPEDVTGIRMIDLTPGIAPGLTSGLAVESAMLSGVPIYYGVGDTFMDIEYLDLRRRWIKTVARELSADPDYGYVVDPITQRWTIYTYGSQQLFVDAETTIYHAQDFSTIPEYSHKWVADYALTEAMLIVGRTRSKYDSIPVAGTKIRLDGQQMIEQATSKQRELIEQIQSMRADLFPRYC